MFMEILRNMWRRKFRTFLTIMGIVVGIFAFTVMGSMALKLNKMIDGGKKYMTGQITIVPLGSSVMSGGGGGTLPLNTLNEIAKVEGVDKVAPIVEVAFSDPDPDNPTSGGFSMGPPPTIEGYDTNLIYENRNWRTLDMQEGRMLQKGDGNNVVALGNSIALDKKAKVGDKIKIRGREFEVIGILAKTLTGPDSYAFVNIKIARQMLIDSNPFLKSLQQQSQKAKKFSAAQLAMMPQETKNQILEAQAFKTEDINTMAGVSWKDGQDSEVVADRIKSQFKKDVLVLSPQKMGEEIDKASIIFNAIILGVALIALVVGGFSIINTMIMSISERTKEIGIKKALGASGWIIAREYTLEAGIIGFLGGILGTGVGLLLIDIFNNKMAEKGAEIFLVSPGFLFGVILFSFALGIIAGVLPAIRAARMKAVDAIREL